MRRTRLLILILIFTLMSLAASAASDAPTLWLRPLDGAQGVPISPTYFEITFGCRTDLASENDWCYTSRIIWELYRVTSVGDVLVDSDTLQIDRDCIAAAGGQQFFLDGLWPNTQYRWIVRAVFECGDGTRGGFPWISIVYRSDASSAFTTGDSCNCEIPDALDPLSCGCGIPTLYPWQPCGFYPGVSGDSRDADTYPITFGVASSCKYWPRTSPFSFTCVDSFQYQVSVDPDFQGLACEIWSSGLDEQRLHSTELLPGRVYWWRVRGICYCDQGISETGWTTPRQIITPGPSPQSNGRESITNWDIPTARSGPSGIAAAVPGTIFFTETLGDRIGRLDVLNSTIDEWFLGAGTGPRALIVDQGLVVFGERDADAIGRLDPSTGDYGAEPLPTSAAFVTDLAASNHSASPGAWFVERDAGQLGHLWEASLPWSGRYVVSAHRTAVQDHVMTTQLFRITDTSITPSSTVVAAPATTTITGSASGAITEWSLGLSTGHPYSVASAPDGSVWITTLRNSLLRFDASTNTLATYELPAGTTAVNVTVDRSGYVWFTEGYRDKIAQFHPPSRTLNEWGVSSGSEPVAIAAHPTDGTIWFTEREGGRIACLFPPSRWVVDSARIAHPCLLREYELDPTGAVTHPVAIAIEPVWNQIWFATEETNTIGRLIPGR